MTCGQVWWPILGICALHLTHPSAHTASEKLQKEHKDYIKVFHTVKTQWFNASLLQYNLRVRGRVGQWLSTFTWVLYLSTLFEYLYFTWVLFFLETYDFNFTTFERQILYLSLHYIYQDPRSRKLLLAAALKVSGWFFSSLKRDFFSDSLSVITLVGLHEVISQHFLTLTSIKCDIYWQQLNNKKLKLWYRLVTILFDFAKLCKWKYCL